MVIHETTEHLCKIVSSRSIHKVEGRKWAAYQLLVNYLVPFKAFIEQCWFRGYRRKEKKRKAPFEVSRRPILV